MDEGTVISTPGSAADSSTTKNTAPKDKPCPFCGQTFTSSSLGRHLDVFIRERNPKPDDGVHHVDEIRKLRGSITRRQARNASGRRGSSTPSNSKQSSQDPQASPAPHKGSENAESATRVSTLNQPGWEVNGVMRDIPAIRSGENRKQAQRQDMLRKYQTRANVEGRQKLAEVSDEAKAAELALREVLGSIKAASSSLIPPPLDFDPFALTFPALILRCLPPAPTVFSDQSISNPSTWSLDPPGSAQLDTLHRYFRERYLRWRRSAVARTLSQDDHNMEWNDYSSGDARHQEEQKVLNHISDAFGVWKSLSDTQRLEQWRLEALRAVARGEERRKEQEAQLEKAQQEAEHLRQQNETISRCQQPREFLLHPPTTLPLPKGVAASLNENIADDPSNWDYDRLIVKWKTIIRENRKGGMATQQPLPAGHLNGLVDSESPDQGPARVAYKAKGPIDRNDNDDMQDVETEI